MPLPDPEPGLVICYEFLWSSEHRLGYEEGRKRRPCVVLEHRDPRVIVAPITHSPPRTNEEGLQLPRKVIAALGLSDTDPSWIIFDELNEFTWPGIHIFQARPGEYKYGYLPPKLFDHIRQSIDAFDAKKKHIVQRPSW
jgi:hypothetical protein